MEDKHYMISDAAKLVDVETHVLRYWEEELEIEIPRNEMGHRYYTETYIQLFCRIKQLKEQGYLLKAIKPLIPDLMEGKEPAEPRQEIVQNLKMRDGATGGETGVKTAGIAESAASREEKMEQFRKILGGIVTEALQGNNDTLGKQVSARVSDRVVKEMDILMQVRESKEEEHFRKFDELLRSYQKNSREAAATEEPKKRRFFFSRKK